LDRSAFEALCTTWANLRKVQEVVAEQGWLYTTKRGVIREHPAVKLERRLAASFLSSARDFGLTPMSRKRLGVSGAAAKEPSGEDALDEYFFGRRN
jgi:P27 family predicted phage terminase small subunit